MRKLPIAVLVSFFAVLPLFRCRVAAATGTEGHPLVTMIVFGARHCVSCRLMAPVIAEIRKAYQGRAAIHYLDADDNREEARRLGIQTLPTQVFLDDQGRELERHLGFWDAENIKARLSAHGVPDNEQSRGQSEKLKR